MANEVIINCRGPKKPGPHMCGMKEHERMVSEKSIII